MLIRSEWEAVDGQCRLENGILRYTSFAVEEFWLDVHVGETWTCIIGTLLLRVMGNLLFCNMTCLDRLFLRRALLCK